VTSSSQASSPASTAITPRTTRLLRVPGLRALQRAIASAAAAPALASASASASDSRGASARGTHVAAKDTLIVVPSEGAADQLRQTLRSLWSAEARSAEARPVEARAGLDAAGLLAGIDDMPAMVTRGGVYAHLAQRLAEAPPMLDELAREVLFKRAADAAVEQGDAPPFEVRPGLIPEMLALYDALRRQHRTIDDFERLVGGALEAGADIDRGARRLLQQTRFLVAAFRAYEASLGASASHSDSGSVDVGVGAGAGANESAGASASASANASAGAGAGALDEHGLRARLISEPAARPLRKIIICVPDVRADAAGLWPADFDLLTRLPHLAAIDLIATERLLATGYLERLLDTLPEIDIQSVVVEDDADARPPVLLAPPPTPRQDVLHFISRDREEELSLIASSVRDVARAAVVYQKPLPYLYLARQVFGAHGVPWQAMDALPLAAEPYAAALDLVLTFVASGYTRNAGVALLRSPHFLIVGDGYDAPPRPADIAACDTALREADFLGGRDRLTDIVGTWTRKAGTAAAAAAAAGAHAEERGQRHGYGHGAAPLPALSAMLAAANALASLEEDALPSAHLAALEQFLLRYERFSITDADDPLVQRHLRARAAMLGTITGLREAFLRHGERPGPFRDVAALVHRWLEGHTFNPRVGSQGVHLVDVPAAMFGRFSRVALVGVLEGEWPSSSSRNIFYPSSLLRDLSWPTEAERRTAARATFEDLLHLAADEVMVSVCSLENDSIVRPSPFVEDLASAGLEVLRQDPATAGVLPLLMVAAADDRGDEMQAWATLRAARSDAGGREFHGWTGAIPPRAYSVTGIDRYLQCPFKYFASSVLRLDEEQNEQPGLTPLERGRFEHEVFQEFFARWHGAGHGAIDEAQLDDARALFGTVVEDMLPRLPFAEREIERTRLLGSAVSAGLGERIFRFEAARPLPIVERLIEFKLDGEYDLPSNEKNNVKQVRLRGVADRIDLLADGTLRLIDYKTGKGSGVNRTIQLPVYAFAAEQRLDTHRGRHWRIGEAGYLAFGRTDPYILAIGASDDPARVVNPAIAKLRDAVDRIEEGQFPVTPVEPYRCVFCGYAAVCRKDYVGDS
jgi:RecB family exonuclease